jgi:hypothetical protein
MEKTESKEKVKEILENEINLNLSIKSVKVVIDNDMGKRDEYYKLYVNIKEPKMLSQGEINYQLVPIPDISVGEILRDIKKLYSVYIFAQNEKLEQGVREEILKLIALLVWVLG